MAGLKDDGGSWTTTGPGRGTGEPIADKAEKTQHQGLNIPIMPPNGGYRELRSGPDGGTASTTTAHGARGSADEGEAVYEYKVYKRRWFGLVQLTLLNIIVSWDVSTLRASLPLP
jgi:hypothetical protein